MFQQLTSKIKPLKRTRGRPPKQSSALVDDTPIIPVVKLPVKTGKKIKVPIEARQILKRSCKNMN